MKKLIAAFAAAVACLTFSGCSSTQLTTAQQLFASDCTVVNADLLALSTSTLLNADQQNKITALLTANKGVCAAVANADVSTLKNINDSLLPAAIIVVSAVPAIPNQPAVLLALNTLGPIVQQLVDQAIAAAAVKTAPAVPASSASTVIVAVQ